jgi:site-specific DNA-methyltransferase (adenine-specific)
MQLNTIYNADTILDLKTYIPPNSIDLIITDPPYGIDFKKKKANYNRNDEFVIDGYQDVPSEVYEEFTRIWVNDAYDVLKPNGSMYVFSGWNNLVYVLQALKDARFTTVNHLIWKYPFGVYTTRKYVTSHYHCLLVTKHPKKYTFNNIEPYQEDVVTINREYRRGKKKIPTQLPTKLIEKLMLNSSNEGDIVLDQFLGSGTTAVVAQQLQRNYIGMEIVEEYCMFARERLDAGREGAV